MLLVLQNWQASIPHQKEEAKTPQNQKTTTRPLFSSAVHWKKKICWSLKWSAWEDSQDSAITQPRTHKV